MATKNLAVAVALAILLAALFTVAYARAPVDLPEDDVTTATHDLGYLVHLPESNSKITEPEETKLPEIEPEQKTIESDKIETTPPLTVITFRPINRHFAESTLFPFRRGRGCHGRHRHFNQLKIRDGQRSYGDDMILSGGQDLGFDGRWAMFDHHNNKFSFMSEQGRIEEKPHHHRDRRHRDHRKEEEEEDKHESFKGGLMKGIRKFLNNF